MLHDFCRFLSEVEGGDCSKFGAKAARLATAIALDLPVPPGFAISIDGYRDWQAGRWKDAGRLLDEVGHYLRALKTRTGSHAGVPMLVSVRAGAPVSMPGLLRTVVNVGLTPRIYSAWASVTGDSVFVHETYAQFLASYGVGVLGIDRESFERLSFKGTGNEMSRERACSFQALVESQGEIPDDPLAQVASALDAVFRSWDSPAAADWRRWSGIPEASGTGAIVQVMILGNHPGVSGTGVACLRDPVTGEAGVAGSFLLKAQGDELLGGFTRRRPFPLSRMKSHLPDIFNGIIACCQRLEEQFGTAQEIEFTFEDGRLWLLQVRDAVASPRIEAPVGRVGKHRQSILMEGRLLAQAIGASSGLVAGPLLLGPIPSGGECRGIVLQDWVDPLRDLKSMRQGYALITLRGGATSHAATLMRKLGKPYVTGCREVQIRPSAAHFGPVAVAEGTTITVDGESGRILLGEVVGISASRDPATRANEVAWVRACHPDHDAGARDYLCSARELVACSPWNSEKATLIELLQLVPEAYRLEQILVEARNKDLIRSVMLKGIDKGYAIGPKCCNVGAFKPGRGFWQTGIRTPEEVDEFLENPDFEGPSGLGGYPRWLCDETFEAIVLVHDPPDKGAAGERELLFVVFFSPHPDFVRVEVALGTSSLRKLEATEPEDLIHLRMAIDSGAPGYRGRIDMTFGETYLLPGAPARAITLPWPLAGDVGGLPVEPAALFTASELVQKVFLEWWNPPFALPFLMSALESVYGVDTLEFQGRRGEDGRLESVFLFDAKGHEELALAWDNAS